ncbi:DUF6572 domain-containing protein [Chthonobacter albigriseus]|uniref:DUF6572 domain-containing protein n=1 Tax=Chthonobacter albigriseus TaxID=1683161 RepID=UPI0015EFC972|nr:DUF6572 domain-containing protein [Chthonobacter albigriseus]
MAIKSTNTVDNILVNHNNKAIVLAIEDEIQEKIDDYEYLNLVIQKVGAYIAFLDEGELKEVFEPPQDYKVFIVLFRNHREGDRLESLLDELREVVKSRNDKEFRHISIDQFNDGSWQ